MATHKVIEIPIIHPSLDPVERELFRKRQKREKEHSLSSSTKTSVIEDDVATHSNETVVSSNDFDNDQLGTTVSAKAILSPNDMQYFSKPSQDLVATVAQSIYDESNSANQSCFVRLPPVRWLRRLIFDYTDKQFLKQQNITMDRLLQHDIQLPALALLSSGIITSYEELSAMGYSGGNEVLNVLINHANSATENL